MLRPDAGKLAGTVVSMVILFFSPVIVYGDEVSDRVKSGNDAFLNKDYTTALDEYQIAEGLKPESPELHYNIASVLYEQGKYEESIDRFKKSIRSEEPFVQQAAHYNLGNSYFRSGDYLKAIESYQNALGLDPDDMDAKFNLELARKMLKESTKPEESQDQNQQQQKQQDQQQDENEKNQDENNDQQSRQDEQERQEKSQDENDQRKNQQERQDKEKMSREDAERILNALRDDEQKQQEKIRRVRTTGNYTGEDW